MLPLNLSTLTQFAVRPQTVQRDELGRTLLTTICQSSFVSLPYDKGSRACYVEGKKALVGYKKLAERIVFDWPGHLARYQEKVTLMQDIARRASQAATKQEMADAFTEWQNILEIFSEYFLAPFSIELVLDPRCRELLQQYHPEHAEEYFSIISTPDKLHEYQLMRKKIMAAAIASDASDHTCQALAKKYGWYNEYSYIEPLLEADYFKKEILATIPEEAKKEIEKMDHDATNAKKKFADLMKKMTDPELRQLADMLHVYTILRTERIDWFKQAQATMRIFFDHVADMLRKETNEPWSTHLVVSLTHEEIMDYLSNQTFPSYEEAGRRISEPYIYYSQNNTANFIYEPTEIERWIAAITSATSGATSVKGTIAFKGIVTGKVAILKGKHDLAKVQLGDILVAPTTMPDYLPAMNKAIAFVTDEGGITSHAAIVARELKKPCIVGTKQATQIFNDGDLVEVNADTGVVKKI